MRSLLPELLTHLPDEPHAFLKAWATVKAPMPVLDEAERHGLDGVLLECLRRHDFYPQNSPQRAEVDRRYRVNLGRGLSMQRGLADIVEALDGLEWVLLKGWSLAERVYPQPQLRTATDIDVLVRPRDIPGALDALEKLGYRRDAGAMETYFNERRHNVHLRAPGRPFLELHFRPFLGFGAKIEATDVWNDVTTTRLEHVGPVRNLQFDCEGAYLAVHSAVHLFSRLVWLYDLKLMLRDAPGTAWKAIIDVARGWQLARPATTSLQMLRLIGLRAPQDAHLTSSPHLFRRVMQFGNAGTAPPHTVARLVAMAVMCESPRHAARWAREVGHEMWVRHTA